MGSAPEEVCESTTGKRKVRPKLLTYVAPCGKVVSREAPRDRDLVRGTPLCERGPLPITGDGGSDAVSVSIMVGATDADSDSAAEEWRRSNGNRIAWKEEPARE